MLCEVVDERHIEDVLVDTIDRRRYTRTKHGATQVFQDTWNDEDTPRFTVYATLPEYADEHGDTAIDLALDTTSKVLLATGGNRSGKTELGVSLTLIRWAQWGGNAADRFRILAPVLSQSHIVARKLLERLPPALILHCPEHERTVDQSIRLADSTEIQLRHAGRPGTLKGDRIKWTHWTEASVTEKPEAWIVSVGRTADCAGQIFLDTTPASTKHWIKASIIDKLDAARAGVPTALSGRHYVMATIRNPWIAEADVLVAREAAAAVDPALADRDFDGQWTLPGTLLFGDLLRPLVHVVEPIKGNIEALGLIDITRAVTRGVSKYESDWICGVDVNFRPTRVLACKVFARSRDDGPEKWGIYVHDVARYDAVDAYTSGMEFARRWDGRYRGALVVMDGTSCHDGKHPTVHTSGKATSPKVEWERHGFRVIPPTLTRDRKPINPSLYDSSTLVRGLLREEKPRLVLDRRGAPTLWEAMLAQEDAGDGTPVKKAGSYADREHCSQTDPLRYIAWVLFGSRTYGKMLHLERMRAAGPTIRQW